ncbi:MAG: hypothetical protein AAB756_02140 [Patescibacteria group bacterium]
MGDKVGKDDKVDVKSGAQKKNYAYFAYNKPKGAITHSPQTGEKDIRQSVPLKKCFPGRKTGQGLPWINHFDRRRTRHRQTA